MWPCDRSRRAGGRWAAYPRPTDRKIGLRPFISPVDIEPRHRVWRSRHVRRQTFLPPTVSLEDAFWRSPRYPKAGRESDRHEILRHGRPPQANARRRPSSLRYRSFQRRARSMNFAYSGFSAALPSNRFNAFMTSLKRTRGVDGTRRRSCAALAAQAGYCAFHSLEGLHAASSTQSN